MASPSPFALRPGPPGSRPAGDHLIRVVADATQEPVGAGPSCHLARRVRCDLCARDANSQFGDATQFGVVGTNSRHSAGILGAGASRNSPPSLLSPSPDGLPPDVVFGLPDDRIWFLLPLSVASWNCGVVPSHCNRGWTSVVGGDWNFMQKDEERLRMNGSERRDTYLEADRFESFMQRFTEVSQPHYTFRRRRLASGDNFRRIDRWYSLVDDVCFRLLSFMAGVVGAFATADVASDHLPITLRISASDAHGCRRRRLHADIVRAEIYQATLHRKLELLDVIGSPSRRLAALISAAHSAAKVTERAFLQDASAGPRLLVEAALRSVALARAGQPRAAHALCQAVPRIGRYATADEDVPGLSTLYRRNMEAAVLADLASPPLKIRTRRTPTRACADDATTTTPRQPGTDRLMLVRCTSTTVLHVARNLRWDALWRSIGRLSSRTADRDCDSEAVGRVFAFCC